MANNVIIPLTAGQQQSQVIFPVQGDGVSLTATLPLSLFGVPGTPSVIFLSSAHDASGNDVSSNIFSSVISGNNIDVTFNTGFATLYTLIMSSLLLNRLRFLWFRLVERWLLY